MTFVIAEIIVYLLIAALVGLLVGYLLWYRRIGAARAETNVMAAALHERVAQQDDLERQVAQSGAERDELRRHAEVLTNMAERNAAEVEALRGQISQLRPLADQVPELRQRTEDLRAERDRLASAAVDAGLRGDDAGAQPEEATPPDSPTVSVAPVSSQATGSRPSYVGSESEEQLRASPDELQRISGIGPHLEELLNRNGMFTFRQIAMLTPQGLADLDDQLGFKGRIERDEWLRQARELHQDTYADEPENFTP